MKFIKLTLVTDFVPSEMACFASSPGRINRTEVWISRDEIVDFFEYDASSARCCQYRRHSNIIEHNTYSTPQSRYARRCRSQTS